MEKEIEDLDSQNQAQGLEEIDFSNADAAKAAYQKLLDSNQEVSDKNKQLFSRAKKAEGFELVDGKWVKPKETQKELPKKIDTSTKEPSTSGELDYGEKAYLRSALNLKGADELQLANDWKNKYGSRVDEMESDEVFLAKLNNLREARASAAAIPKGTKRPGEGGVTDVDLAVAKYRETGELPSEWELRNKVIDKAIIEPSKGNNALFSGK